jgi:hypothetical protein
MAIVFITVHTSLFQVFGCLLDPRSFNSLEEIPAHKHASLPITFDDIKFIPTTTITPIAYLKN